MKSKIWPSSRKVRQHSDSKEHRLPTNVPSSRYQHLAVQDHEDVQSQ